MSSAKAVAILSRPQCVDKSSYQQETHKHKSNSVWASPDFVSEESDTTGFFWLKKPKVKIRGHQGHTLCHQPSHHTGCTSMTRRKFYKDLSVPIKASLRHIPLDKMAAISKTTISDAISWMKSFVFWLRFHWSLFLRFQLTIFQHWFRQWLGTSRCQAIVWINDG